MLTGTENERHLASESEASTVQHEDVADMKCSPLGFRASIQPDGRSMDIECTMRCEVVPRTSRFEAKTLAKPCSELGTPGIGATGQHEARFV